MNTKTITKVAIMVVLVFVGTFLKIPIPNGYCHLGDGMIILGVVLLGTKKGALAGGSGAALADLISGYAIWIIPTFIIKIAMALIIGFCIQRFSSKKNGWMIGTIPGGVVQVLGYMVVGIYLYGTGGALLDALFNTIQTVVGIVAAYLLIHLLRTTGMLKRIQEM